MLTVVLFSANHCSLTRRTLVFAFCEMPPLIYHGLFVSVRRCSLNAGHRHICLGRCPALSEQWVRIPCLLHMCSDFFSPQAVRHDNALPVCMRGHHLLPISGLFAACTHSLDGSDSGHIYDTHQWR